MSAIMRAKCKSDKAKLGKEMTMKQDVSISINAITEQIRYKIINYGSMWVTATQALLCLTVGYYVGIDSRSASPEYFPELAYSIVLLFFACIVFSWAKRSQHRDILLAFGALFTSGCAIFLTHITNAVFLAPDDGKKILLISFLIMLMSWNASRLVLGIGTLPIVLFYTYLTSTHPDVALVDIVISSAKFPILLIVFYSTVRKFFEFVEEKLSDKIKGIHRLEKNSHLDELTRIKNRKGFNSDLNLAIDTARRSDSKLAIAILDIDFFKQYNDTKGHPAGDLCLKTVAATLRSQCRRSIDSVCRIGGEEFALIMPATSANQAASVADNIRMALSKTRIQHPKSTISDYVTVSIGIAEFGAKDDFESLYQRADKAMYKAKVGGRDQSIICFEECALCNSDLQTNANVDALGLSGK